MTIHPSRFNDAAKRRILIVDDEEDIVFSIKYVLEDSGYQVDSYNAPLLALENFAADLYSVAIFDIKMPEMSGFELYEKISAIDNKVKVIFLTALTELRDYE